MSTVIISGNPFHPNPKNKINALPKWFTILYCKIFTWRYKDLLVPNVTITQENRDSFSGVGVAYHINRHRIFGYNIVFPSTWGKILAIENLKRGFEIKLTRHLNMVKKGTSRAKAIPLKKIIDFEFGVNCLIKPLPKRKPSSTIVLGKGKTMAHVWGQLMGQYPKGVVVNKPKRKKKFNPSQRDSI